MSGWQFTLPCIGPPPLKVVREWTFLTFSDQLDELERLFYSRAVPQSELDRRLEHVQAAYEEAMNRLDATPDDAQMVL